MKTLLTTKFSVYTLFFIFVFIGSGSAVKACDSTPIITLSNVTDIGSGFFTVDVEVCIGDGGSASGITTSMGGGINITGFTPATLIGNTTAVGSLTGGVLNYNYAGGVGPGNMFVNPNVNTCFNYTITVDGNPANQTVTFVGINSEHPGSCAFLGGNTGTAIVPPPPTTIGCGDTFYDPGGVAGNYNNNANVTYNICPTNPGDPITLDFSAFALENGFDFLNIWDGTSATGPADYTFTGTALPGSITSTNPSGCLTLVFTSDGSVTNPGFAITVNCLTTPLIACGSTFYDPGGVAGNYANNSLETYTVCPTNPGDVVTIDFTAFDLENGFDFLNVWNGNTATGPADYSFTGAAIPPSITSTDPNGCVTLVFQSDGSVNASGFAATVSCNPPIIPCGTTFYDPGGAGGNYTNNSLETYYICNDLTPGDPVTIDFNAFALENGFDFFSVWDGTTATGPADYVFTGTGLPGSVTSTNPSGCLTVVFQSDGSVTAAGFSVTVNCIVDCCLSGETDVPTWTTAANALDVILECSDVAGLAAAQALFPVATDNCDVDVTDIVEVSGAFVAGACPQEGTYTNTWTVTDCAGNVSAVYTQTITINDPTGPTASNPAAINVECIGDVPAANVAVVNDEMDNCTVTPVVAFVSDVSDGLSCPETITRTYSITDDCGNQTLVTQSIIVNDITPPTASNLAAINVECIGDVPVNNIALIVGEADNCTVAPTVAFVSDVSDGLSCPETITRTYSVTDDCGNQLLVTQSITVNDVTNPTASNPATTTVAGGSTPAVDINVVIDEADNCTAAPTVAFVSETSNGASCPETITRIYSVTDDCGNTIDVTHVIIISDPTPPTASNPAPISVECIGDVPAVNIAVVTDEADNQGIPTVAFVSEVSNGASCPEVITRTYSVTDNCLNEILVTHTITVNDITPPTASNPAVINVECIGDVPAENIAVVNDEADNCTVAPTVAFVSDVSDGLSCPETITRTYSITDDCGNQTLVTQSIIVNDITPPTASNLAAINVECIGDIPPNDVALVVGEADNCSPSPVVAFVGDVSDGLSCPETITRTYSVTDDCGNQTLVTQTITVNDVTPPTASNPATTTVPGGPAPAVDVNVVIDEADNCTVAPIVAFVSESTSGAGCPETITRIYSVTDDCGNTIDVTHIILLTDPILPTASNPAPINVECIGDVPAPNPAVVTDEVDNQGVPTVAFVSDVSNGAACPEVITRTYSVTDVCLNVILVTQTITINDITAPTASNPAAINVECIGDIPAANIAVVNDEADNCTVAPTVAFVSDVSDGLSCPETITRTYSVTDDCGNQILVTQSIIVNDITPPTASNLAAINVECIGDVPANDIALVIGEADNCTLTPVVAFVGDVSDGLSCPETITRTYSVTDDCGNQTLVTQSIVVNDITNPTASNPATTTVPIGASPAVDVNVVIDEADNCTVAPIVAFVSESTNAATCPETVTRIYSVTDDCGNTINVTHIILITDPILPTASNPAPINVECIGDVPAVDITVVTDEADNQGVPTVAFVSDVSNGASCPEVITRTYSVTDLCLNEILVTQTITINDMTVPTASNPAAINVECIGDVPAANTAVVNDEADNCTVAPTVAFVSDVSDGLSCPETITRTYSITDDCGNQTLVTQSIIVNDITPPTASNLAAINVECIGDVPANDVALVVGEADNCTLNPVVAFVGDVSDGLSCPETITRTYSVTDDCGNQIVVTQSIVVNDITPPTASNLPPLSVPGAINVPAPNVNDVNDEADNCTVSPTVVFVSDISDGNVCDGEIITRTYSITDDCGNQTVVMQEITIEATTPPVTVADETICEGESVTLTANNPSGATITWDQGILDGVPFTPAQTLLYTVTAEDNGCFNTASATVTVQPLPEVLFSADNLSGCAPLTVTFTNLSVSASPLDNCVWDIEGSPNQLDGCNQVVYTFQNGGVYDVTLTTTSTLGCTNSITYADYINVEDVPIASFSASPATLTTLDTEVEFTNTSSGALTYDWNFGDSSPNSSTVDPTHTFPDEGGGTYEVVLAVESALGCVDTARLSILVEEELIFYVPNTFSPDGDEYNNEFFPVFTSGYDPYDYKLLIFNRWGEIIFESNDANFGWDGTYLGRLMQDGVYVWKIEFKQSMNDKRIIETGNVNLIR